MKNKTKYTATYKNARYTGKHPYIQGTDGVYYWNEEQNSFLYRPNVADTTKVDWYRVNKLSLEDAE